MASAPVSPAESVALLGPILLGDCAQLILYGGLVAHAAHFMSGSLWPRFSRGLRAGILAILLLVTLSSMTALYDLWFYGTLRKSSVDAVLSGTVIEALEPLLVGLTAVAVQTIMALRVSKVVEEGKWRWMYTTGMGCLITVEFLACVLTEYYQMKFHLDPSDTPGFPISYSQAIEIWMLLEASVDIVISVSYLLILRGRLGWKTHASEGYLRLIVRLTLQSALITTLLAIVTATMVLVYPGYDVLTEDIYFAFMLPQPSVYALSLFATLAIAEKSRRHSREVNAYLVDIDNPNDLPLPKLSDP